ncbi:Hypothetical protein NocV09_00600310 [Nannochloropsis oceanica]
MEAVPNAPSPMLDRIIEGHGTLPLFLSTVAGALLALFFVYLVRALHRYLRRRAGEGESGGTGQELEVQYTELPRRRRGRRSRHFEDREEEEDDDHDMIEDIFDDLYGYEEELDFGVERRNIATPTFTHASPTSPVSLPPLVATAAGAAATTTFTKIGENVNEISSSEMPDNASEMSRPVLAGVVAGIQQKRSEESEGRGKEGKHAKGRLRDEVVENKWEEDEGLETGAAVLR